MQAFARKELTNIDALNMKRFLKESEFLFYLPHPCIIKIHGLNIVDETHPPSMILTLEPQNRQDAIESGNLSNLQKCEINVEIYWFQTQKM